MKNIVLAWALPLAPAMQINHPVTVNNLLNATSIFIIIDSL
ncbi:hypothetical protein [Okeania sp. SIO3I5]|nr:hypothetical protein [Okeania sp. SIO3I5]